MALTSPSRSISSLMPSPGRLTRTSTWLKRVSMRTGSSATGTPLSKAAAASDSAFTAAWFAAGGSAMSVLKSTLI